MMDGVGVGGTVDVAAATDVESVSKGISGK
jgi:hypothetical protein